MFEFGFLLGVLTAAVLIYAIDKMAERKVA